MTAARGFWKCLSGKWVLGWTALLVALISVPLYAGAMAQPAPDEPAPSERCKIGLYFVDLHHLDMAKNQFEANFWLWSLCPKESLAPLKTAEFVNANRTAFALDQTLPRDGVFWSARKVDGAFRHAFDVRNFPFDRHVLKVIVEEGIDDLRSFGYEPDLAASGLDRNIELAGWKIESFRLNTASHRYATTFGDPTLAHETPGAYSQVEAEITVSRASRLSFLKMTAPAYVAAVLALLSFFFSLDAGSTFSSRMSFLASALFATVVNMRVASSELGSNDGMTLIDLIHVTVLALIIAATVSTLIADRRMRQGKPDIARRYDRHSLTWCASLFVAVNVALIASAILAERV